MRGQSGPYTAIPQHKLQSIRRNTRRMQQCNRYGGNQRCLFGGFGHHAIARNQSRDNLPHENCQRKIPWADCNKHTARAQAQQICFACRARQGFPMAYQSLCFHRIITAEIRSFPDFGQSVIQCFARFLLQQMQKQAALFLKPVGRLAQCGRTFMHRYSLPFLIPRPCRTHGNIGKRDVCFQDGANDMPTLLR